MPVDPELHDLLVNYGGFVHTKLSEPEADMYENLFWRYIFDWRGVHVSKSKTTVEKRRYMRWDQRVQSRRDDYEDC